MHTKRMRRKSLLGKMAIEGQVDVEMNEGEDMVDDDQNAEDERQNSQSTGLSF